MERVASGSSPEPGATATEAGSLQRGAREHLPRPKHGLQTPPVSWVKKHEPLGLTGGSAVPGGSAAGLSAGIWMGRAEAAALRQLLPVLLQAGGLLRTSLCGGVGEAKERGGNEK